MFLNDFDCGYINKPYCSLKPFDNNTICPKFSCPQPNLCNPNHHNPKHSFYRYPHCCLPDCFPINPPHCPPHPHSHLPHCPPHCFPRPDYPIRPHPNYPDYPNYPTHPRPPVYPPKKCSPCNLLNNFIWFYGGFRCGKKK